MSSGSSQPTSSTVTQTTVPEYLRPYVEEMAGQARGLAQYEIESGYKPFQGQRFAGFSPMQAQAFQNVAQQQLPAQLTDASNIAFGAGTTGLQAGSQGQALGQQAGLYGGMGAEYGALGGAIGSRGVTAAEQGFGAGQAYQQMATDPNAMQSYMSPYMQNVVEAQQREARRASEIQQQSNQAQAVQQGAYGGSRQAIVEAERQRNLGTQLGDIQAAGLQKAYQDAQQSQQFGANLGLQGLGAGYQGLQTGLAGTAQGISGAQAGLQGVQGAIGAGQFGLSGAQAATGAAQTLGGLGGQQFDQQMATSDAMQKYGALQQQQQQQGLDYQYQQYLAEQNLPYQQLAYFSDMIRGLPLSQSSTQVYGGQPDVASQLGGLALAGYGAFGGRKEGGQVKKYQAGGAVSADGPASAGVMELPSMLRRLSDSQLAAYARTIKDAVTLSAIQNELSRRDKMRQPQAQAPQITTAEGIAKQAESASVGRPRVGMYGGGIVALQAGGPPMPAFTGGDEYGVDPATLESVAQRSEQIQQGLSNIVPALESITPQGPYSGMPSGSRQAPVAPPPAQGDPELDDRASPVGIELLSEERRQEQAPAQTGDTPSLSNMSFDQWRQVSSQYVQSPEDAAVLADMKARVDARKERAEGRESSAIYDALLMGGLAMMSGTSFAEGLAKAAQTGGATFLAGKQGAAKAIDAAEDAELAFNQYKMSVRKGDEKAAQSAFESYMNYRAKMEQIGAARDVSLAKAQPKPLTPQQVLSMRTNIARQVDSRFKDVIPSTDSNVLAQQELDRQNFQRALEQEVGIPPLQVQSGSGSGAGNRPALSSFIN